MTLSDNVLRMQLFDYCISVQVFIQREQAGTQVQTTFIFILILQKTVEVIDHTTETGEENARQNQKSILYMWKTTTAKQDK